MEVVECHFHGQGDKLLSDVFGDRFAVRLGGEVIAALRWGLVDRTDQQIQMALDLILELLSSMFNKFELRH